MMMQCNYIFHVYQFPTKSMLNVTGALQVNPFAPASKTEHITSWSL